MIDGHVFSLQHRVLRRQSRWLFCRRRIRTLSACSAKSVTLTTSCRRCLLHVRRPTSLLKQRGRWIVSVTYWHAHTTQHVQLSVSSAAAHVYFITLCAKLSGAVYCNRSCLWVCLWVCVCGSVTTITRICVHRSSPNGFIGKGSDHLQLIKFWPSCAPRSAAGRNLGPPNNFWMKRAICFKFGTDIEDGASLHRYHKTTPKWALPGSRDLIS